MRCCFHYQRFIQTMFLVLFAANATVQAQEVAEQQEDVDVAELMQEGLQLSQSGEHAKAAEVFRRVTEADDSVGQAWLMLGYSLHMDGKLDEAIKIHEKASTMRGFESIGLYNIACVHSLQERKDPAFDYLERALDADFDDTDLINTDTDLDGLRKDPRFKLFEKWVKTNKKPDMSLCHFSGTWTIVGGSRAGTAITTDDAVPPFTVSSDRILMPGPGGQQGFEMSYTADPMTNPMQVEMKIEAGPGGGGTAKGIVLADRKSMKICYDPTGENFPESFEATEDNGFFLFESKRVSTGIAVKDLEGEWNVISGNKSGIPLAEGSGTDAIIFTADTITIANENDPYVMSYSVDSTKTPVTIDMTMTGGPAPEGMKAFGILKREGDDIVLCYNAMGENRPESFESTEENQFFVFKLHRAGKKERGQ